MALLDPNEGVAGGNTPPKFYVVICIENLNKGFVTFDGIVAIVMLCIDKVGHEVHTIMKVMSILKGLGLKRDRSYRRRCIRYIQCPVNMNE